MIYIRTILAIYILFLLGDLGHEDSRFIAWLYDDLAVFTSYRQAESFSRIISWFSVFLFLASCLFVK